MRLEQTLQTFGNVPDGAMMLLMIDLAMKLRLPLSLANSSRVQAPNLRSETLRATGALSQGEVT